MDSKDIATILAALVNCSGSIIAALIVGVAGALISTRYSRERDKQDKESQWRQHAIELTKLDLERKLKANIKQPLRPSILDFLANYRDLQELGKYSPKELYLIIEEKRISKLTEGDDKKVEPLSSDSK